MKVLKDNLATNMTTNQTLTDAYVTVGEVLNTGDIDSIAIFTKFVVNDSANSTLRVVGLLSPTATDEYEIDTDSLGAADVNKVLVVSLGDLFPFIKIQVKSDEVTDPDVYGVVTINVTGSIKYPKV